MGHREKENKLFIILACFFIANVILAEFIGVKIFNVEETLGIEKFDINLLGVKGLSFNMSAGIINWPIVFISTDIINEYYGIKGVRFLSNISVILIVYVFAMAGVAIWLAPSDFWIWTNTLHGKINMNDAFSSIFGQSMWIIIGSSIAFLSSQLVDVLVFHKLKTITGRKTLWLRATGSTLISQFVDSFVVIFIAFYLNPNYSWTWQMVAAIGLVNYTYKFIVALLTTPLLYIVHDIIDRYLGKDLAKRMTEDATQKN